VRSLAGCNGSAAVQSGMSITLWRFLPKNPGPAVLHNEMPLLNVSIILVGAHNCLFHVLTKAGVVGATACLLVANDRAGLCGLKCYRSFRPDNIACIGAVAIGTDRGTDCHRSWRPPARC
jgi:hypothetical protein